MIESVESFLARLKKRDPDQPEFHQAVLEVAESLATFFKSERVKKFFAQVRTYPSKKCIDCEVFEDCAGGCPLLWTVYSPDSVITGWSK